MIKMATQYRPQGGKPLHAEFIIGRIAKTCGIYKPAVLCMEIKS